MNRDQEALDQKWAEVRQAELKEIAARREKAEIQGGPQENLTGLALSGGGIRSASFNLGVLQALVEKGFFRYVDYLSTVSGGGYIGSFVSSLAYRQHLNKDHEKRAQPAGNPVAHGYVPPPIATNADSSQPEATKLLATRSNFLNDKLDAISRYLIGWFLNFITLFSGLVFLSAVIALLWRLFDMPAIANFKLFFSGGLIQDWNRPFLPAFFFLVIWVVIWSGSYFQKGDTASARHSGKFLVLSVVCLLIGLAIWFGTPNMTLPTALNLSLDKEMHSFWNAHQQWLLPLAIGWALTMLPLLRPEALLKSGIDTQSPWKGWVFTIAGYGAVIGIPFATIYFIGRHNVSRVAYGWERSIVADDIVNWEKFWWQIRDDAQRRSERLTPAILLYDQIFPKNEQKKTKLQEIIENDQELFRMQNVGIADQPIGQFFTDLATKESIADLTTKALDVDYLQNYRDLLDWQLKVERLANQNLFLSKEAEWAETEHEGQARGLVFKMNLLQLDKTKLTAFKKFLNDRQKAADDRLESYRNMPDQEEVQKLIQETKENLTKLMALVKPFANFELYQSYRDEITRKINGILDDPDQANSDARNEAQQLSNLLELYRFYHLDALDETRKPYKKQVNDEWLEKYPKHAAAHLLLRLFYPTYLRPIQLANRAIVIAPDQRMRFYILLVSGGVFLFFASVINFNGTSMHGFYRRCIQRAFLVRHADTEDDKDHRDIRLQDMTNTEEGYPYHILSGCVEFNTGKRGDPTHLTAFQFAKLYCGGREIDFCKTESYRKGAMSLSSAAAISGAAVSPTRIRYLLLQVVMMITNMRLGQWLPNPAKSQDLARPTFVPLLRIIATKLAGRETLDQGLLFVTDGGHYENLGIEVLLDRRCRLIIASDAGADPTFEFADLANVFALARRKGIRFLLFQPGEPNTQDDITLESVQTAIKYSIMASWKIKYPDGGPEGFCVYLKSSLIHPQPFAVGQYKLWNEEFPHDATSNQFFHEQQFEVYRDLGNKIALKMIERMQFNDEQQAKQPINVDQLLKNGVFGR